MSLFEPRVRIVDETGSTNADVAALARAGEPEGLVLVAEHQRSGRGRLDRVWTSPPGSGLTFSVLLRPDEVPAPRWGLLPLLVGVGVAAGLRAVAGVDVGLKWPNDLMVGERKLGGILVERVETASGAVAVAGVGVNITLREDELPVPTATSLVLSNAAVTDRDAILQAVLQEIASRYGGWRADGGVGTEAVSAYRGMCVTLGRDVRVELPGEQALHGRAVDIAADGALVIESPDGRRRVGAGDVRHVR